MGLAVRNTNAREKLSDFVRTLVDCRQRPDNFEEPRLVAVGKYGGQHPVRRFGRRRSSRNARHGLLGHVVGVSSFSRSATNRHHTDRNHDRATIAGKWKPCRRPGRTVVAWKRELSWIGGRPERRNRVGPSNVWPAGRSGWPCGPTHIWSIPRIIAAIPKLIRQIRAHGDDGLRDRSGPDFGTLCGIPEVKTVN